MASFPFAPKSYFTTEAIHRLLHPARGGPSPNFRLRDEHYFDKFCCKCEEWQSLDYEHFARDDGQSTGFHAVCRDCDRARVIAWKKKSRKKLTAQVSRRLKRVRAKPGSLSDSGKALLMKEAGHACSCCGAPDSYGRRLVFDHILPTTHPQCSNAIWNRQALCNVCNARKASEIIDYRKIKHYQIRKAPAQRRAA